MTDHSRENKRVKITDFIMPAEIADKILETDDRKVRAYYINNIYLKIDRKSHLGKWVGLAYTESGKGLYSCLNGRRNLAKQLIANEYELIPDEILDGEICALTRLWSDNYFHFSQEIIDKLIIAEELGFAGKYLIFHETWAEEFVSLTGISSDRIIWVETGRGNNTIYKIDKYFDIDGFTQGTEKSIPRISKFADRIVSGFFFPLPSPPQKNYFCVKAVSKKVLHKKDRCAEAT